MFNRLAGFFVSASKALLSLRPYSRAFLRFAKNCLVSFKSAAVIQKLIPAFSNAAGLVGAISQFFKSASDTNRASLGSSTSIACGKFSGRIKLALVAAISAIRWYSLPPALIINCTPNSSPMRSARKSFHLSLASKICGNSKLLFQACRLRLAPSVGFAVCPTGKFLYHCASKKVWRSKAIVPIKLPG